MPSVEERLDTVEQEIRLIRERNRAVEKDKAWETSWTRRVIVTVLTWVVLGAYMWAIQVPNPWLNAIVPAVAFVLATAVIPPMKTVWLKYVDVEPERP